MRESDKFFNLVIEELNMGNLLGQKIGKKKLPKEAPFIFHDGGNYRKLLNIFRDACCNQHIKWNHVVENPLLPWDYYSLSENKGITMDIVERTPELPWDYSRLSKNPNVTREFYENNLDKDWRVYSLTQNPNFDIDYILSMPKLCEDIKWSAFCLNPNVTWDVVVDNPELPWHFNQLSSHPNITWDIITEHPDPYKRVTEKEITANYRRSYEWYTPWVSLNPNITWEIVESFPDYNWSFSDLSCNPNINYSIVKLNSQEKWSIDYLFYNPSFSIDDVFELFRELPKYMRQKKINKYCNLASINPNLTVDVFRNNRANFSLSQFVKNKSSYYCPITNFYEFHGYYD
jgi:hypothetical protein